MYFDRPGLILLVLLATFGPLAGLAFIKYLNGWKTPHGIDALFSGMTLSSIILLVWTVILTYLAAMYDEYTKMRARDGVRPHAPQPEPVEEVKPRIFVDGKQLVHAHAFVMPQLKVNVEMLFARALIAQSRGLLDVKLTETYWVKSKRWEKLGGVGALDFRDLIDRWERAGAIKRKNPNAENSTYVIDDGLKIGRAAAGEKLQPLPRVATPPG